MVRGIIFDMDGLMVDSERLCCRLISEEMEKQGLEHTEEFYKTTLGMNEAKTRAVYLGHYGKDLDFDALLETVARKRVEFYQQEGVPIKKGLNELLDYLKEKQIPAIVASGSDHEVVAMTLSLAGLQDFIVGIVGGDEVEHGKPDPEVFQKAAARLNLPCSECLVLEDSYNGLLAALNAGIPALCIPDMIDPLENGDVQAEGKLEDLNQVIAYLEKSAS